ncbi:hypothetical protein AABB24_022904, partial [Solanum stoloniferum]
EYLIIISLFFFLSQSLSKALKKNRVRVYSVRYDDDEVEKFYTYVCGEFEGDVVWLDTITLLYVFIYSSSRLMLITNKLNTTRCKNGVKASDQASFLSNNILLLHKNTCKFFVLTFFF